MNSCSYSDRLSMRILIISGPIKLKVSESHGQMVTSENTRLLSNLNKQQKNNQMICKEINAPRIPSQYCTVNLFYMWLVFQVQLQGKVNTVTMIAT